MDYKKIGKTIKNIRKARDITQEELAEKINSSAGYISNIESGNKKLSLNKMVDIAKALDTTLDAILISEYKKSEMDCALIKQIELMIRSLDKEQKEEFMILATNIIEAIKQFKK